MRSTLLVIAFIVALTVSDLSRRFERSITVYPVISCPKGCSYITAGHTWKRQQVALDADTFTAIPERQEVVHGSGGWLRSMSQEQFQCAVADARNWRCDRTEKGAVVPSEMYTMEDGKLLYAENPFDGATTDRTFYATRCYSWQLERHNAGIVGDEPLTSQQSAPGTLHLWFAFLVDRLTGCWI